MTAARRWLEPAPVLLLIRLDRSLVGLAGHSRFTTLTEFADRYAAG